MSSLFLSYARADDEPFVTRLYNDLKRLDFDVWWDRERMPGRALTFLHEIREAIDAADRLILVVGPGAASSDYVRAEWGYALSICKPINPILRVGDYRMLPEDLRLLDAPDFRDDSNYDARLETLLRQIGESVVALGKLVAVPDLPPHFLPRPDALTSIKMAVLADLKKPMVVTGTARKTGLQGMGGLGKSVLASALARDCEVRRAFPDGILWAAIGTEAAITARQAQLAEALGDAPHSFEDTHQGKARLSDLLNGKACLLILDDVWSAEQADAFDALGPRCRMLITTRDAGLITALGAVEHRLDVLSPAQALSLLSRWSGKPITAEARAVAKECGYLPLALALSGAQARDGTPWSDLHEALREADLEFFSHPHGSIMKSLKVSVDALHKENAAHAGRYTELAVFPEDTAVPEATILTLWQHTGKIQERTARRLLSTLSSKALLRLTGELPNRRVEIHDLQRLYLCGLLPDMQAAHETLLDAYRRKAPKGWPSGPDDGYFFERLIYHLAQAGQEKDVRDLLLDFDWLSARLNATEVNSLITDFNLIPGDAALQAVEGALRLSAHILNNDKTQLAGQLIGRLGDFDLPEIRALLDKARKYHGTLWLGPLTASLVPPGGSLLRTLAGHERGVKNVVMFPDGKRALSASGDETLKLWDVTMGAVLRTFKGHSKAVADVDIFDNGRRAISASWDSTLKIWDVETGAELRTLAGHHTKVNAIVVHPDGWRAVSASSDRRLKVWDIENGSELLPLRGHSNAVNDVALTPDGKRAISASSDKTVRVWEVDSGTELQVMRGHTERVNAVAAAPDGRRAVSVSNDNTLRIWDIDTGALLHTLTGHDKQVNGVDITPDGKHVISASNDNTLRVWDLDSGTELITLFGHSWFVDGVTVTPDGHYAISASLDRTLKIWDLENDVKARNKARSNAAHANAIQSVVITPDGKRAVTASSDATLKVWDVKTQAELLTLRGHDSVVNSVTLTPDSKQIISTSWDRTLRIWDIDTGVEVFKWEDPVSRLNRVAVTPDGMQLVCGSEDTSVKILDRQTGTELNALYGHAAWITAVALTPDGKQAISASHDHTLKIWDMETGRELHTLSGHLNVVASVVIFPDGKRAISTSWDHTLKIWDLATGQELRTLSGHGGAVNAVSLTLDGKYAISASAEYTLHLWNLETGAVVARFNGDGLLTSCAVTPDGKTILAGEQSGRLHFLRLIGKL